MYSAIISQNCETLTSLVPYTYSYQMQKYFCPHPIGFKSDHPNPLLLIMPLKVVGTGFDGFPHNLY